MSRPWPQWPGGDFAPRHPAADTGVIDRFSAMSRTCLHGRYLDYLPLDMRYHDFEHTLQAALCLVQLLEGRYRAKATPVPGRAAFRTRDRRGAPARHRLPQAALRPRGHRREIHAGPRHPQLRLCRQLPADARLHRRRSRLRRHRHPLHRPAQQHRPAAFCRRDRAFLRLRPRHRRLTSARWRRPTTSTNSRFSSPSSRSPTTSSTSPREQRLYRSVRDLIAKTPVFWEKFVLPKINQDYLGVYRFLADPYPGGPNPYIAGRRAEHDPGDHARLRAGDLARPVPKPPQGRNSRSPGLPGA